MPGHRSGDRKQIQPGSTLEWCEEVDEVFIHPYRTSYKGNYRYFIPTKMIYPKRITYRPTPVRLAIVNF
jgi:hypothetical protein